MPFATSIFTSSDFEILLAGSVSNSPLVPESRYFGLGISIDDDLFIMLHDK